MGYVDVREDIVETPYATFYTKILTGLILPEIIKLHFLYLIWLQGYNKTFIVMISLKISISYFIKGENK